MGVVGRCRVRMDGNSYSGACIYAHCVLHKQVLIIVLRFSTDLVWRYVGRGFDGSTIATIFTHWIVHMIYIYHFTFLSSLQSSFTFFVSALQAFLKLLPCFPNLRYFRYSSLQETAHFALQVLYCYLYHTFRQFNFLVNYEQQHLPLSNTSLWNRLANLHPNWEKFML